MNQFHDDVQASVPSSPASPESLAARMIRALRLASLRVHAKRMCVVGLVVLAVGSGVTLYLAAVGTESCWQTTEGKRCVTTEWYPLTIQRRSQIETLDGVRDGQRTEWHANGEVWVSGRYEHGRRVGEWQERWPSGTLRFAGNYVADKLNGTESWWYANGGIEWQVHRKDGVRHGQEIWWHPNGNRRRVGSYDNGARHGVFSIFSPEGRAAFTVEYQRGKRLSGSDA